MDVYARYSGERVMLTALSLDEESLKLYYKWMNEEEILPWLGRQTKVITMEEERQWAVERAKQKADEAYFSIYTREDKILIGTCRMKIAGKSNANLGIRIGNKDYRGKGYGTETMGLLTKFCFEEWGVHRCMLSLADDNQRAWKCYTKVGFKEWGREHEVVFYRGRWHDCVHMEMLASEWFSRD